MKKIFLILFLVVTTYSVLDAQVFKFKGFPICCASYKDILSKEPKPAAGITGVQSNWYPYGYSFRWHTDFAGISGCFVSLETCGEKIYSISIKLPSRITKDSQTFIDLVESYKTKYGQPTVKDSKLIWETLDKKQNITICPDYKPPIIYYNNNGAIANAIKDDI